MGSGLKCSVVDDTKMIVHQMDNTVEVPVAHSNSKSGELSLNVAFMSIRHVSDGQMDLATLNAP